MQDVRKKGALARIVHRLARWFETYGDIQLQAHGNGADEMNEADATIRPPATRAKDRKDKE